MKEIKFLTKPDFTGTLKSMEVDDYFNMSISDMEKEVARNMCCIVGKRLGRTYKLVAIDTMQFRVMRIN